MLDHGEIVRFYVHNAFDFGRHLQLSIATSRNWANPEERIGIVTDLIVTQQEDKIIPFEGIIPFPKEAGQDLMDQLWQCGIRPSHQQITSETMQAMKDHLTDMQKLVFGYSVHKKG